MFIDHQNTNMTGQNALRNKKTSAPYSYINGSPKYDSGNLKDEISYRCPVERKN